MRERARKNFTVAFISGLRPEAKRYEVHDPRIPGWTCRVAATGRKSFTFTYRHLGRHRRSTIGSWPVSADAQRDAFDGIKKRALEMQAAVAGGEDPVAEERASRAPKERTLVWAAGQYVEEKRTRIKTWQALERILKNHWIPRMGDMPLTEIRRADLYDHVIKPLVRAGKHGAAGEAKKAISGLLNYCVDRDWIETILQRDSGLMLLLSF